ncbi:hypothetical protein [Zavarzinella formosa]|uniref:hypothetical protein n=1 Tax=Zavarzinella formosa TaxID=360055 RepID=UPI001EE6922F|nr:hypothetical protein [Zavarzinella formosa]
MTEIAAERLTPARAAELTKVLDLKCQWENMRVGSSYSTPHLHSLQKAFEAYRTSMLAYTAGDRNEPIPDLSPSGPNRLRAWCRTLRVVFNRAGTNEYPTHVLAKAFTVADRIAERMKSEPANRESATDMNGAIRQLDAVIAWCDKPMNVPVPSETMAVHEVGGRENGI